MLVMADVNAFGDNHTLPSEIIIGNIVLSVISHAAELKEHHHDALEAYCTKSSL